MSLPRPIIVSAGLLAGLILVLHAIHLAVPAEDAFISYRFARHVVDGHGFVWNIGDPPVEGYTNFLWVLICAIPLRLGMDVEVPSQVLGVIATLLTMLVAFRHARRDLALGDGASLVACGMLALSGPVATWGVSGMETPLFMLLALLACTGMARWLQRDEASSLWLAFPAALLATLTRPEGFAVFVLLAGLALLVGRPERRKTLAVTALAGFVVPFAIYFAWRYTHFGYLLPNTFYAKTGGTFHQYLRGAKYTFSFWLHFIVPLVPVLLGVLLEHARIGLPRSLDQGREWARRHAGLIIHALLVLMFVAYVIYVGGDYMAMYRFFVPILPAIYLLFAAAAHHGIGAVGRPAARRRLMLATVGIAAVFTLLQSTPFETRIYSKPWFMNGTWRGVVTERWHVDRLRLLSEYFIQTRTSKSDSLALRPVGVVPFLTEMPSMSFVAIVEPALAHRPVLKETIGTGFPGHERSGVVPALARRPTFVMYTRYFTSDALDQMESGWNEVDSYLEDLYSDYTDEIARDLRRDYDLRSVWLEDTVNREAGYLNYLVRKGS